MAVMDDKINIWIKEEEPVSDVADSMFCEGPLSIDNCCVVMKEEPELNFDASGLEHNTVEDSSVISDSTECTHIKQDVELDLEAEETEHFAHANLDQFEVAQLENAMKHEQDTDAETLPMQQELVLQPSPPYHQLTLPSKGTGQHKVEPELVALQHPAPPPSTPPVSLASTVAMVTASVLLEDVGLFPQQSSVHYTVPETQNLQSIRTTDNMMESVCAPVLDAASGTMESMINDCCDLSVDHASHHNVHHPHDCEEQVPLDAGSLSPTTQQQCELHHRKSAPPQSLLPPPPPQHPTAAAFSSKDIINDDALMSLPVLDLNLQLGCYPREEVIRLKQKRRTLKNRGYAKNHRSKWMEEHRQLEITNRTLVTELKHVKVELARITQQRDLYKKYLEQELCVTIPASRTGTASAAATKPPPSVSHR